jgi:hypothetical protein
MTSDREIVCARVVFFDSEFDAKKDRGERPGFPVCFCAIEVDRDGREIEHRLAKPYPERPPWERGDPFLAVGFALSAEAGSMLHMGWPFPLPAIDLLAEYMALHNTEMCRGEEGGKEPAPTLIQACQRYGAAGMDQARKDDMRALAYTKTRKESCATKLIKNMVETYPLLKVYYEDKRMIDALRNLKLVIGDDGRNRCWLNPFGTKTGRNNPSTNRSLFGLPHTMRSFMKPPPGMAIAQVDYGSQEIGIAAALSGDPALRADYLAGDPYRAFAAASLGILDPTKQQRQVYKSIVLGRIYGMGAGTLGRNVGIPKSQAQRTLDEMAARYPVLEAWLARVLIKAAHCVPITCVHGWSLSAIGRAGEERTFLNFPMQANAAELMRLVFVRSAHLPLIWCAHDSFLVEDRIDAIEGAVAAMREMMRGVSRDLLGGFELRADCDPNKDIVRHPDRFVDEREREDGMRHWNWLMTLIEEKDDGQPADSCFGDAPAHRQGGEEAPASEQKAAAAVSDEVGPHPGGVASPAAEDAERARH